MAQATQVLTSSKCEQNNDEIWALAFGCQKVGKRAYTIIQGTVSYTACTYPCKS